MSETWTVGRYLVTRLEQVGVYSGALSEESVRRTVEEADAVLSIGVWMSDINLDICTAQIDVGRLIHATADRVRIKRHYFDDVYLGDFIAGLSGRAAAGRLVTPAR